LLCHFFFAFLLLGLVDGNSAQTAQTVVVHDDDIVPLHTSLRETTLIVLPEKEKAMGVFCGDKSYWTVDVIPGAERYVAVKPSKAGIATDIHVVTDHNHSYTFEATESGTEPATLKVLLNRRISRPSTSRRCLFRLPKRSNSNNSCPRVRRP
jgi:hypothetical protein